MSDEPKTPETEPEAAPATDDEPTNEPEGKSISMSQLEQKLAEVVSQGVTKNVNEAVAKRVDEVIKEKGLDKVDRKFVVADEDVAGQDEKGQLSLSKKQRVAKFIKATALNDKAIIKELSEGVDSEGGFLVPEEFRASVARIAGDYGYARRYGVVLPMKRDQLNVPTEGSSVTVYWPGEGGQGTESSPTFDQPRLLAKTAMGITTASNELLEDADVDVIDYLMDVFAESLASEEDEQAFNGVGVPFTGILEDSNVNVVTMSTGNTSFEDVVLNDLIDLRSQVKASVLPSSGYFMHREIWGVIQKLTENSQHILTFSNPMAKANGPSDINPLSPAGYIQGYPVYVCDVLPELADDAVSTPFITFGSLGKGLFFGDRKEMTLDISKDATINSESMFERNKSAVRVTERVAITVGLPDAFAVLETSAT